MTKISDIMHENGRFWVYRAPKGYWVMKDGPGFSISDGIEYPKTPDGLSIAVKYCDYRAGRAAA